MSLADLKELAQNLEIENFAKLKKNELMVAINQELEKLASAQKPETTSVPDAEKRKRKRYSKNDNQEDTVESEKPVRKAAIVNEKPESTAITEEDLNAFIPPVPEKRVKQPVAEFSEPVKENKLVYLRKQR